MNRKYSIKPQAARSHTAFFSQIMAALLMLVSLWLPTLANAERTTTYFHTDALGSVVAASDESGQVLWRKSFEPFGFETQEGQTEEDLSFTGKPLDDTGLQYYGARYYDPQAGRFMGVDPVGYSEDNTFSFNKYIYANQNPYKFVDPDGRQPTWSGVYIQQQYQKAVNQVYVKYAQYTATEAAIGLATFGLGKGVGVALGKQLPGVIADGAKKVAKNVVDPKRIKHIFRDKKGHLPDTPENRKLLENVADNPSTTLGNDKFGNTWSGQTRSDGSQVWTQTRDGKIINGGVNQTPKQFNPETGLSSPVKPGQ